MSTGKIKLAVSCIIGAVVAFICYQLSYQKAQSFVYAKDVDHWLMIADLLKYTAIAFGGGAAIFALLGLQARK